ncbi:GtrA family protein [Oryzifoliimicrobium ureilyticus]|uniref:GtrA family protein n=1 Tax=Oryzifoliimicrobium ureilyticus TaxID=3113724 RepID=UPI0030762576
MKRLACFVLAGGAGFLTDAGILALLQHLDWCGLFLSRLISIAAAISVTWQLNRRLTFGRSGLPVHREGIRYAIIAVITAIFNYAFYSALLISTPMIAPLAAMALSTIATMGLSFFGYARYVFSSSRHPAESSTASAAQEP